MMRKPMGSVRVNRASAKASSSKPVIFSLFAIIPGILALLLAGAIFLPISASATQDEGQAGAQDTVQDTGLADTQTDAQDSAQDTAVSDQNGAVMPTRRITRTVPHISDSDDLSPQSVDLPSSFDLRNVNGVSYVTPVRNQDSYSTCWAFAFCAAAESSYLMKTGQTIQLSPLQVAYYTYNTPRVPRKGLEGDSNCLLDDTGFYAGGDKYTTGFSTMSWTGLVDESAMPYSVLLDTYRGVYHYPDNEPFPSYAEGFPDAYAYSHNTYQVREVTHVNLDDRDAVKAQLMERGAAYISFYSLGYGYYYDWTDGSYSYYQNSKTSETNHAVTLIGWDDDYDNFSSFRAPEHPGAWLAKNSWGTDRSYLWISYEDTSLINGSVTFVDVEPVDPNEQIFQYDGNSAWSSVSAADSMTCANVFTSRRAVELDQVSCYLSGSDITYRIQVYTDIQDEDDPTSGAPALNEPVTGTFGGESYLRVPLPQTVSVPKGGSFSVVLNLENSSDSTIDVGTDSSMLVDDYVNTVGHAEPGQSFWYSDDYARWLDLGAGEVDGAGSCNLRIKAYGDTDGTPAGVAKELAGSGRYETAALIALEAYPKAEGGADGAIIATGKDFPDALGAAGLAGMLDWPILLTEPGNLPQATREAIEALGADEAIIVGGSGAVSHKVFLQLEDLVGEGNAVRVSGADRYKTAEAVYNEGTNRGYWGSTAIISTGTNYPDALSISGFAFSDVAPIFLCDPKKGLSAETKTALLRGGFDRVIIVGGTGAVPASAETWARNNVTGNVQRLAGNDRYLTSKAIAEFVLENGGTADGACIATGKNFPDALAGGPLVGRTNSILLLADPGKTVTFHLLSTHADDLSHIYYLGGIGAVPQSVRDAAEAAAGF